MSARMIALTVSAIVAASGIAQAQTVAPAYASNYSVLSLGTPSGVPAQLGGINFLDNDTLLIGGNANVGSGAIYQIDITRDIDGNIIGYAGAATLYATAPNIDGGLWYMPNGTLAFTTFSNNSIGQILPGGSTPASITSLTALGVASSTGTGTIIPAGFNGAGKLIVGSYSTSNWYDVAFTANPDGTYAIGTATQVVNTGGGPEGIVYVPVLSPQFDTQSVLISEFAAGRVSAYQIDANGFPIPATRQDFITGLNGAEGGVLDPVTGQFLFSTFGGGNQIIVTRGFAVPTPGVASLAVLSLAAGVRRRSR